MRDLEKKRESNRRYAASARGKLKQKEYEKRYNRTLKGITRRKRYEKSYQGLLKHDRYRAKVMGSMWISVTNFESHTTTFWDLEYLMGRKLTHDEKDWWTIVQWTGADRFLSLKKHCATLRNASN